MWNLVYSFDREVGWYMMPDEDGKEFNKVLLYPQTSTYTTFTTNDLEMMNWFDSFPDDEFKRIRCHGHSHVNMDVWPSSKDLEFEESIVKQLKPDDRYVFLICNKLGEMRVAIYTNNEKTEHYYNLRKDVAYI